MAREGKEEIEEKFRDRMMGASDKNPRVSAMQIRGVGVMSLGEGL